MDGDRAREQDREGETKTETETMTQTHTVNEIKCCFSECATLQNGPGSSGMRACMHACVQTDRTEPDRTGLTDGRRQTDRQTDRHAQVHAYMQDHARVYVPTHRCALLEYTITTTLLARPLRENADFQPRLP